MNDSQRLLRNALRANGAFSALSGLVFLLDAGGASAAAGLPGGALRGLGAGLLGFAGLLAFVSSRPRIPLATAMAVVWADLLWVGGTVPVVLLDALSHAGSVAAIAIADVVLLFAILQYLGVRRVRGRAAAAAG